MTSKLKRAFSLLWNWLTRDHCFGCNRGLTTDEQRANGYCSSECAGAAADWQRYGF